MLILSSASNCRSFSKARSSRIEPNWAEKVRSSRTKNGSGTERNLRTFTIENADLSKTVGDLIVGLI